MTTINSARTETTFGGSQIWGSTATPRFEQLEAAPALSKMRAGKISPPVKQPAWASKLAACLTRRLASGAAPLLRDELALAVQRAVAELAPPGTEVEFRLGDTMLQIVVPDPEFDAAVRYLRGLSSPLRGSYQVAVAVTERCAQVLRFLRTAITELPIPTIGPGPDGVVGITWETEKDHLDLDVFPDGHLELFHEDLRTAELWSDDQAVAPTRDFVSRLRGAFSPA